MHTKLIIMKRRIIADSVINRIKLSKHKVSHRNNFPVVGESLRPLAENHKSKECLDFSEEEPIKPIKVVIRIRPVAAREVKFSPELCITMLSPSKVLLSPPSRFEVESNPLQNPHSKNRRFEKEYEFDRILNEDASQEEVYNNTIADMIDGVVKGYNSTIFAYGATGAGKTYTMLGYYGKHGLMPLSVAGLLKQIMETTTQAKYTLYMSYLEVYNENIKDLLCPVEYGGTSLDLREDPQKGVVVAGLTELMVTNEEEVMSILKKGDQQRTKEKTQANEVSSRSHAVLQLIVESKDIISEDVHTAKLILVDLAGSERAAFTSNKGIRMLEEANINRKIN